jgi:hypothetical protein
MIGIILVHNISVLYTTSFPKEILEIMGTFGMIGNSIFFAISGYFHQDQISFKKLFRIFPPAVFYSLLFFVTSLILGIPTIIQTHTNIVNFITYFICGHAWFAVGFVGCKIFSTFVIRLIEDKSFKIKIIVFIILFLLLFVVCYPSGILSSNFHPASLLFSSYLFSGISYSLVYMFAYFIHKSRSMISIKILLPTIIVCYFLYLSLNEYFINSIHIKLLCAQIVGLMLLWFMLGVKVKNSYIINTISGTTWGIYLIHGTQGPINYYLEYNSEGYNGFNQHVILLDLFGPYLYPFAITIILFIMGCLIELGRQRLFNFTKTLLRNVSH